MVVAAAHECIFGRQQARERARSNECEVPTRIQAAQVVASNCEAVARRLLTVPVLYLDPAFAANLADHAPRFVHIVSGSFVHCHPARRVLAFAAANGWATAHASA